MMISRIQALRSSADQLVRDLAAAHLQARTLANTIEDAGTRRVTVPGWEIIEPPLSDIAHAYSVMLARSCADDPQPFTPDSNATTFITVLEGKVAVRCEGQLLDAIDAPGVFHLLRGLNWSVTATTHPTVVLFASFRGSSFDETNVQRRSAV